MNYHRTLIALFILVALYPNAQQAHAQTCSDTTWYRRGYFGAAKRTAPRWGKRSWIGPCWQGTQGKLDTKKYDYWEISNKTPFPLMIITDREEVRILPRSDTPTKVLRGNYFELMVLAANQKAIFNTQNHNITIDRDNNGNFKLVPNN